MTDFNGMIREEKTLVVEDFHIINIHLLMKFEGSTLESLGGWFVLVKKFME